MPKTSLLLNFSFLLLGIVLSFPLVANANSSMPNSEVDIPLCYVETADGRTLNLTALCGPQPEEVSTPQNCISDAIAARIPVSQVSYDGNTLTGQVTNQNCKTVNDVKVNYRVLDNQGNQIDNGFLSTQPATVPPGKTAEFGGTVVSGSKADVTHIELTTH